MQAKPDRTEDARDEPFWQMPGKRVLSPKVAHLRQKLYLKAKQEAGFRFYTLYEAVCRMDVLLDAWHAVRKNEGCPGVDGVNFKQIEESPQGVVGFLHFPAFALGNVYHNRNKIVQALYLDVLLLE